MKTARIRSQSNPFRFNALGAALLAGTLMGGACAVSAAEYYRWTDENGVTHFTDKPPTGKNVERVMTRSVRGLTTQAREVVEPEAEEPVSDEDRRRCTEERERLSVLQSNARIQIQERDGTTRELSAEAIQQEIAMTRRAIERFCR